MIFNTSISKNDYLFISNLRFISRTIVFLPPLYRFDKSIATFKHLVRSNFYPTLRNIVRTTRMERKMENSKALDRRAIPFHREWFVNIRRIRLSVTWIIGRECNRPIEIKEPSFRIFPPNLLFRFLYVPIFIVRRMERKFEISGPSTRHPVPSQMIREHSNSLQGRLLG